MARAVAARLGLPVRRTLRRRGDAHQTGRTRAERLQGPRFEAVGAVPPAVLVVDDVCTTGATLSAAASVVRAAGAVRVHGLVLARTPPRRRSDAGTAQRSPPGHR